MKKKLRIQLDYSSLKDVQLLSHPDRLRLRLQPPGWLRWAALGLGCVVLSVVMAKSQDPVQDADAALSRDAYMHETLTVPAERKPADVQAEQPDPVATATPAPSRSASATATPAPTERAAALDPAPAANNDGVLHERLSLPERQPKTAAASEPASTRAVEHWRETSVSQGDTFARLMQDEGIAMSTINALAAAGKAGEAMNRIYPGDRFRLGFDDDQRLERMIYRPAPDRTIRFERDGDRFEGRLVDEKLQRRLKYVRGTIHTSLFGSASAAGLSDRLTMDLVEIFRWDVDFIYGIRRGDRFMAVYETFYRDGRQVETGNIVAAEFVNRGETYRAVRYQRPNGSVGYYTPSGNSTRKAFVRTPVKFTRISSRYGRRDHPILSTSRMHYGVDFAAPRGTPIHATGNGRIVFRGRNGGFGNMVVLEHAGRYTTRYGHMSRFARGQRVGTHVAQGDVIGYVGSTGLSTGPHVHYDFEIDGEHRNPLKVDLPNGKPVPDAQLDRFRDQIRPLVAQLGTLDRAYAENTR